MTGSLFPHFRDNEEAFTECAAFWWRMFEELTSMHPAIDWEEGFTTHDPSPPLPPLPLDMRLVLEAYSRSLRRAMQIDQSGKPTEMGPVIRAYMKEIEAEVLGDPPDLLLVIRLELTTATAETARRIISAFVDPTSTRESLQAELETLNAADESEQ
jgi:hypothetical protein